MKKPKKVKYLLEVDEALKTAFLEACINNESDGAKVLRSYMKVYVQKHGQQKLF